MRVLPFLLISAFCMVPSAAMAQASRKPAAKPTLQKPTAKVDPRSVFPGRRVGGGTRGECTGRTLVHLVPVGEHSVFAPGQSLLLGVLVGPTATPWPLTLEFRSEQPSSNSKGSRPENRQTNLPAASAGITLLRIPSLQDATIWESANRCDQGVVAKSSSPLNFIDAVSPPAKTLLVTDTSKADQAVQASLQKLRTLCGKDVARQEVATAFSLNDVMTPPEQWPQRIPVRCL